MNRPSPDPDSFSSGPVRSVLLLIALGICLLPAGCAEATSGATGPSHFSTSTSLAVLPAETLHSTTQEAAPEQPILTPDDRADIEWLISILRNPSNDLRIRAGAAVRLMGIGHPSALEPLVDALRGDDVELKSAVAVAINDVTSPPPQLLEPAIEGLRTARGATLDQLSLALARYGARAHGRLLSIVHNNELEVEDRLGAVNALGMFRTHDATEALMRLLSPDRDEPQAIVSAACAALQHATGLPYGDDAAEWRAWWAEAGDLPPEQWLTNLVHRLSEQLTRAEQKVEREREVTARVQQRLAQAYRDLFPRLELEEQLRSLPGLLDDPLPTLRDFALDRIARLLRDSVRIPEEIQDKLAERLDDETPALRLQAARLLEQMNYDRLAARLGKRLLDEKNDELIEGFLDILAKRPGATAFPAVVPLLASDRHGERAAIALWEIINYEAVDEESLGLLRAHARGNERLNRSPAHTRLLARAMPDDELEAIVALMDGEDAAVKLAVAEGLMRRGAVQPLLDRVSDESIYPFAARAIARTQPPWSAFRQLISLLPPQAHESIWRDQLMHVASRLSVDRVLEADDLLAAASGIVSEPELRIRIIQRRLSANGNGNQTPAETIAQITLRLAELLLLADQPEQALERLEAFADAAALPEATPLRFRAMLRTAQYDRAQQLVPEPNEWIVLLARWVNERPEKAIALRREIERRFNGRLNDDLQDQLEAVSERLPIAPPDAASGGIDDPADADEA